MISKEEFKYCWKDSSTESILNQFYYEHILLRKRDDAINKALEWLKEPVLSGSVMQALEQIERILEEGQEDEGI